MNASKFLDAQKAFIRKQPVTPTLPPGFIQS
ncbi:hypothetical protein ABIC02_007670 [Bradyrhizobium sp. RT5a]